MSRLLLSIAAFSILATSCEAAKVSPLSQDDAKAAILATCGGCTITWKSVQIAPARPASIGEISAAGLPPHALVYPVLASFTRKAGFKRDVTWNYYVFKNDFGKWTAQSNATPGNTESEPY